MNIEIILSILLIHWFADFVLQTDKQAKGKSKNWKDLISHTVTYSSVFLLISIFYASYIENKYFLLFAPITFIAHTITDYFTSRLNSKLWIKGDVHNFFVSIGFDQYLHYIQLFLTYYSLI